MSRESVVRQTISVPSKISRQRQRQRGVPDSVRQSMIEGSKLVSTAVSFPENMGTNNHQTMLKTVMPSISETNRNKRVVFKGINNTRRVTFQPETIPRVRGRGFHSYNQAHQLRFEDGQATNVTSKTAQKSSPKITKNTTARGLKIDNRAIRVCLNPVDSWRLPNNRDNIFKGSVNRGDQEIVKDGNIIV